MYAAHANMMAGPYVKSCINEEPQTYFHFLRKVTSLVNGFHNYEAKQKINDGEKTNLFRNHIVCHLPNRTILNIVLQVVEVLGYCPGTVFLSRERLWVQPHRTIQNYGLNT